MYVYIHVSFDVFVYCLCDLASHMGWLWLVASITLQVSFAEYCLFYRALFQNRPII